MNKQSIFETEYAILRKAKRGPTANTYKRKLDTSPFVSKALTAFYLSQGYILCKKSQLESLFV